MTYRPFEKIPGAESSRWLITCDHATNTVPGFVSNGDLGLPEADMERHIAYDIGAAGVTRELARLMDAPALLSRFSRLVIDPNRGEHDPTIMMRLYDGTIIPGNHFVTDKEISARKDACYHPYHHALADMAARRQDTVIVAIHSFTARLNGRHPRPWHIGILHHGDEPFADTLIDRLCRESDLTVGDNEPYAGHLPGDSIDRHALKPGRPNALIELRQDLIETPDQQVAWARRLAPMLHDALAESQV